MTKDNSRKPKRKVRYGTAPVDLESTVWDWIAAEPYRPFLSVRSAGAIGYRPRIYGVKSNRVVHLLSSLERDAFLKHEARPDVVAIWEQVPLLPHSRVVELAERLRIDNYPMPNEPASTDLLLGIRVPGSRMMRYEAVFVKPEVELDDPRTQLKLACQRDFWQGHAAFRIETDSQQRTGATLNRSRASALRWPDAFLPDDAVLREHVVSALRETLQMPAMRCVRDVTRAVDAKLVLEAGTSMTGLRFAIQHRLIPWPEERVVALSTLVQ